MSEWAWLLPALPAVAAVIGLFGWRMIPGGPAVPAIVDFPSLLLSARSEPDSVPSSHASTFLPSQT